MKLVRTWVIRSGSASTGSEPTAVGELGCHPPGRPAGQVGQVGVGGVQVQSLFLGP